MLPLLKPKEKFELHIHTVSTQLTDIHTTHTKRIKKPLIVMIK